MKTWTSDDYTRALHLLNEAASLEELDEIWSEIPLSDCDDESTRTALVGFRGRSKARLELAKAETSTIGELPNGQALMFGQPKAKLEWLNCDDAFAAWWARYPRDVGKEPSKRKWRSLWTKGELPTLRTMIDKLELQKASPEWRDTTYVMHAHRYLNGKHWNDEVRQRVNDWEVG